MKEAVFIACPPLCDYEKPPEDQSHSEMWLSQAKKGILLFRSVINKPIVLGCYHCINKIALEDPELFYGILMLNDEKR